MGPEMTITAAHGNVIEELASRPAIERLREALTELDPREQQLAASGLMLGIVIDENQPEYRRGDFLVRPIIAADGEAGRSRSGERIRVGQTVRMHIRDGASADEDLRGALRAQVEALGADAPGRRSAVHLQRSRLPHVRGSRPRRVGARRRARRARRRLLLRRRDRAGWRPQLPARVHRDDGACSAPSSGRRRCAELVARALRGGPRKRRHHLRGRGARTPQATARASCRSSRASYSGWPLRPRSSPRPAAGSFEELEPEGQWRESVPADVACAIGPARALLAAERTALNLLCHLSGVATLTAGFVRAVSGTGAAILDTRKTTPGLRALEKAAVAAGGGRNHRTGPPRRGPDQGEPHRARRRPRRGGARALARPHREREIEVECRSADEVAGALELAPIDCCSTTWTSRRAAGRGRGARRGGEGGRPHGHPGGLRRHHAGQRGRDRRDRGRVRSRSAPSPTRPPRSTSACCWSRPDRRTMSYIQNTWVAYAFDRELGDELVSAGLGRVAASLRAALRRAPRVPRSSRRGARHGALASRRRSPAVAAVDRARGSGGGVDQRDHRLGAPGRRAPACPAPRWRSGKPWHPIPIAWRC